MTVLRTAAGGAALLALLVIRIGAQPADLPDRDTFLREARAALARSQQLWHNYAYMERRTDIHMNPFGRMGTGDTLLLEVRPAPNPQRTYRRVIERNGVAVAKSEIDRQDAEYRARIARLDREEASGDAGTHAGSDEAARRRAQTQIEDVLNALRFDLVRREPRDGKPAIVVSFEARPDARPATRYGRIGKVFKGLAWIDEATHEVRHMRAAATDDVSFGGFVAKLYAGTEAIVDRQEIEPGVWMPTRVSLTGGIRALFRKARIEYLIEWFDYRRIP